MKVYFLKMGIGFLIIFLILSCTSSRKVTILCAGDSLTNSAYPQFLQALLTKEGINAQVLNYGRSGNTSGEYLGFLEKNKEVLAKTEPDFILLQLGTNDVRGDNDRTSDEDFYNNMEQIIEIFRSFKTSSGEEPQIILATIPPIPEGTPFPFSPESNLRVKEEINPLIQKISGQENLPLVDNYALFLNSPQLLPEVHPTREGYKLMADNWYKAFKVSVGKPRYTP